MQQVGQMDSSPLVCATRQECGEHHTDVCCADKRTSLAVAALLAKVQMEVRL